MVKRFLITTACEKTWVYDAPVVFLGEWCKRRSRHSLWKSLNSYTMPYHWDDREKLQKDYYYLQDVYEVLLKDISKQLNQIHGVEYSVRYWRILIGPWLGYFTQVLFDRWSMLEVVLNDCNVDACIVLDRDEKSLIPNDMVHFNSLFVCDDWNEAIYTQLLKKYYSSKIDIQELSSDDVVLCQAGQQKQSWVGRLKEVLFDCINKTNGFLTDSNEYFFISSYLPFNANFKTQWRLGQWPKFWRLVNTPSTLPNLKWRQWTSTKYTHKDDFFNIVNELIPRHIPTVYLEGYYSLDKAVQGLQWPKHPKVIFTSNSYNADDVFKAWAAQKVDKGSRLIIGQHGGNFGMTPWSFLEEHQIEISDIFLSWGWSNKNNSKIIPVGNLKGFGNHINYDPNGGALMVEMTVPRYSYHMYSIPVASQWLLYFEDQCRFVNELPIELRSKLKIRLYRSDYGWDQKLRWTDRFPNINLDPGIQPIKKIIRKSRLFVSTYNATTYLESLSWNMPTIIFWDGKYWEVTKEAESYFNLLRDVGIFHDTPESAANKMVEVWDDVDKWWQNEELQKVRIEFCDYFSRVPDNPLQVLQATLDKVSS